jgi:hypothetical protein
MKTRQTNVTSFIFNHHGWGRRRAYQVTISSDMLPCNMMVNILPPSLLPNINPDDGNRTFLETLITTYQTIRIHSPKGHDLNTHFFENLVPHMGTKHI